MLPFWELSDSDDDRTGAPARPVRRSAPSCAHPSGDSGDLALAQLVDMGFCAEAAASALQSTGHVFDRALQRLLSNPAATTGASSSASTFDARPALASAAHRAPLGMCRGDMAMRAPLSASASEIAGMAGPSPGRLHRMALVSDEAPDAKRPRLEAPVRPPPSAARPSAEVHDTDSSSRSSGSLQAAIGSVLKKVSKGWKNLRSKVSDSQWLLAPENWEPFEQSKVACPVPDSDPPCLTLRGLTSDPEHAQSLGDLRAGVADGNKYGLYLEAGAKRSEELSLGSEGSVYVREALLADLFQELLSGVRYPPSSIECSWRVIEARTEVNARNRRPALTPGDLRGPLPKRPFVLLDNGNDTEAAQPPHFKEHGLRPEQLRSLSWMLSREGHVANAEGDEDDLPPGWERAYCQEHKREYYFNRQTEERTWKKPNEEEACAPFIAEWRRFWTPGGGAADTDDLPEQIVPNALVDYLPRSGVEEESSVIILEGDDTAKSWLGRGRVMSVRMGRATVHFCNRWNAGRSGGSGDTPHLLVKANVSTEDLEVVHQEGIYVGALVKVTDKVSAPKFGWGGVKPGMLGVVKGIEQADASGYGGMCYVQFPSHEAWKGLCRELTVTTIGGNSKDNPFTLDLRVRASYSVGGGILADKIGYGKTATTIALIDSALGKPLPPIPEPDRGGFIPAKGTLIIVPSNLMDQWLGEISKFVWDGRPMKKTMVKGWSPKGCPLKIFAMTNVTPLTNCRAVDMADADIVICSYRLLFSNIYQSRRGQLSACLRPGGTVSWEDKQRSLRDLVQVTRDLMAGKRNVPSGRKGDTMVGNWEELVFPILEMFFWRRIVFDEFHELESFESRQQNSLQHMRSHYRWGLTGTPPVSCNAGAIFMSSLFRVDLPGYLESNKTGAGYPDLAMWEGDRLLSEVADRFMDHYTRQNTAELPHIGLEEHVVLVRHSATERALYLGQAHDAPDMSSEDAFATDANRQSLERLLKLCSHFQAVGDTTSSAKEECSRIGEQKERRLVKARNQLKRCARVLHLLQAKLRQPSLVKAAMRDLETARGKLMSEGVQSAASAKVLDDICAEVNAEDAEDLYSVLEDHKPKCFELATILGEPGGRKGYSEAWRAFAVNPLSVADIQRLLAGQAEEQARNLQEFAEARSSFEFFQRTINALVADDSPANRSCVVCLDEGFSLDQLSITPCAHAFCMPCLKATVDKFKSCSICRHPLSAKDVQPLSAEVKQKAAPDAPQLDRGGASSSSSSALPETAESASGGQLHEATAKHGTKLAAVVSKLQELRRSDASAKAILFVQFDDLKRKVAGALMDFGVPCLTLKGSVGQRSNIINDWQNNPNSEAYVLLLSLAQSASGTNLTSANHVVFLHPMLAPSAETAIGYELQAIGRARRHGQKRSVVHVWRFVTTETVEQAITERHQAALWERESARAAREATNAGASGAAASASDAQPRRRQRRAVAASESDGLDEREGNLSSDSSSS